MERKEERSKGREGRRWAGGWAGRRSSQLYFIHLLQHPFGVDSILYQHDSSESKTKGVQSFAGDPVVPGVMVYLASVCKLKCTHRAEVLLACIWFWLWSYHLHAMVMRTGQWKSINDSQSMT